jgi:hypothetical protein
VSLPKYAARRDEGEAMLISSLAAIGWDCVRLSSGDLPDLLCRKRSSGELRLLEVESGGYKRRRTEAQRAMLAGWNIPVVKTFDEAIRALGGRIA